MILKGLVERMFIYNGYDWLGLFFVYSFGGWILETIVAAVRQKRFVNRGLVNGPLCIMYGISAAVMSFGMYEMKGFELFMFATLYAAVIEWIAGHLIARYLHEKWWDYKDIKWNLDGYICLPISLIKGALGFLIVAYGNSFFVSLFNMLPSLVFHIVLLVLLGLLVLDIAASFILMKGKKKHNQIWENTNNNLDKVSNAMGDWIAARIERRINRAYPQSKKIAAVPVDKNVFASGCSIYKLIMLFFIGAFIGDIVETIFCRITMGVWMSRSSVVWGPFSIVWGLAIALATAMLYRYKDASDGFLFITGTFLGGAFEYLCSVFTEAVFGKVFWDYSHMKYNLGGRINLLYCFFWGIAAVVWFKLLYPKLSDLIEKIPVKIGKVLTWILVAFMAVDAVVTSMALIRYDQRDNQVQAEQSWQIYMDEHYGDEVMQRIFPNAKNCD